MNNVVSIRIGGRTHKIVCDSSVSAKAIFLQLVKCSETLKNMYQ